MRARAPRRPAGTARARRAWVSDRSSLQLAHPHQSAGAGARPEAAGGGGGGAERRGGARRRRRRCPGAATVAAAGRCGGSRPARPPRAGAASEAASPGWAWRVDRTAPGAAGDGEAEKPRPGPPPPRRAPPRGRARASRRRRRARAAAGATGMAARSAGGAAAASSPTRDPDRPAELGASSACPSARSTGGQRPRRAGELGGREARTLPPSETDAGGRGTIARSHATGAPCDVTVSHCARGVTLGSTASSSSWRASISPSSAS